jgi:hypothetical protein
MTHAHIPSNTATVVPNLFEGHRGRERENTTLIEANPHIRLSMSQNGGVGLIPYDSGYAMEA